MACGRMRERGREGEREAERKTEREKKDRGATRETAKRWMKQGTNNSAEYVQTENRGSLKWSDCEKGEKEGEREYAVFCHRQEVACDKSPG